MRQKAVRMQYTWVLRRHGRPNTGQLGSPNEFELADEAMLQKCPSIGLHTKYLEYAAELSEFCPNWAAGGPCVLRCWSCCVYAYDFPGYLQDRRQLVCHNGALASVVMPGKEVASYMQSRARRSEACCADRLFLGKICTGVTGSRSTGLQHENRAASHIPCGAQFAWLVGELRAVAEVESLVGTKEAVKALRTSRVRGCMSFARFSLW